MLFNIIPEELIEKKNEQELVVYFKNGSVYQLKGADDPDSLRGAGPVGIVLDEFAEMKFYAWQVVEPILRANGGWCWFIGTPRGKNHLYTLYQHGLRGDDQEWYAERLRASESGIIPEDQLAAARRTSFQAHYNQEYETEFLEGEGSVFRNVPKVMTGHYEQPQRDKLYVAGVDLAKVTDYTVIRMYDRATNGLVYADRFKSLEWPFQKARIKAVSEAYNNALMVLDATGLGDPIADDLLRAGVAVEPFKITEQSKKELVEKLAIWIEQRKLTLVHDEDVLLEYDNFSYEIGKTGKVRYQARDGFHDDIVMADALAVWSLQPLYKPEVSRPKTVVQQYYEQATRAFKSSDYDRQRSEWDDA